MSWSTAPTPAPAPVLSPPWKSPRGPANALRVLLALVAVALVLSLAADIGRRIVGSRYEDGLVSTSTLDQADGFVALATFATGGLTIAILVLTIVWEWRLAHNHELLGRPGTTFGPGWAIGAWFIPLAYLVLPFLQFRELWKGSARGLMSNDPRWKEQDVAPLLWVWWLSFAASHVLGWSVNFSAFDVVDPYLHNGWFAGRLVATGLRLVSAIAYAVVIKRLTGRQGAAIASSHAQVMAAWAAVRAGPHPTAVAAWPSAATAWAPSGGWGHPPLGPPADLSPGWKDDPTGRGNWRYWDGVRWTENTATGGRVFSSPPG